MIMKRYNLVSLMCISLWIIIAVIHLPCAEAQKECDIAAVEAWTEGDNEFSTTAWSEFFGISNMSVTFVNDLSDLETQVQQMFASKGCTCIRNLYIMGHGNSGNISVGNGQSGTDSNKKINGNESKWSGPLGNLGILLCNTSSQVWLIGCNVGSCNLGSDKLYKLAQKFNAIVKAPVDKPYGGFIVDYMTNGRWQTATPSSKPSHMAAKKDDKAKKKTKKAEAEYYCPCNKTSYTGLLNCTGGCSTSLSCFTNICDRYYSNSTWDKYSGNPVMKAGSSGSWNAKGVSQPAILRASPYAMWFAGWDSSGDESIGYATSTDGINWTESSSNPVLSSGASGSWEESAVYGPSVIKDGSTFKMWYTGYSSTNTTPQIGYATSTDGATWTKYSGNPVLTIGASTAWDGGGVGAPSVIKDGGTYKMWFGGRDTKKWWQIGYATSTDGITWTKYSSNPVVTYGYSGTWNAWHVDAPSVVKDGSTYHMLCIGFDSGNVGSIGYFSSTDGISWTEPSGNPHFSRSYRDGFETVNVGHPALFKDSNESVFKAYYRGKNSSTWAIGYGIASSLESNTTTTTAATTTITASSTTTTAGAVSSTTTSSGNGLCPFQVLYGEYAGEIETLRVFRDEVLGTMPEGQELIELYYQWSPVIIQAMEEDGEFKEMAREMSDAVLLMLRDGAE